MSINKSIQAMLSENLLFYNQLDLNDRQLLTNSAILRSHHKGEIIIDNDRECRGLIVVIQGQLRAYTVSPEGKEITLYRLLEGDSCILSASCMLNDINFNINIGFESDSQVLIIPTGIYEKLNERDINVKSFTLKLVSSRFTEVMWVLEKYVFEGMAQRLANELIDKSLLQDSTTINITHEELAKDLGTAREVVSRLLKRFDKDGFVRLSRGMIEIMDMDSLREI